MVHPYLKAWADILIHGFLLLPWYVFEWVMTGFNSRTICLPIKRYWSMNGKNVNAEGRGIAIPFGILEGIAFVATSLTLFYYHEAASQRNPIAYIDAEKLLAPMDAAVGEFAGKAVVRSYDDYPRYLGNYLGERARERFGKMASEASGFTLLDADLLGGLVTACDAGDKTYVAADGTVTLYNENDIAATFTNFTSVNHCNFITFTENCMCAGVYSAQAFQDCIGTSNKIVNIVDGEYVEDISTAPLCVKHGGLSAYIDTKLIGGNLATTVFYEPRHIMLMCAFLMAFSRFMARLCFPGELKKPGAMWVNGWPAALLCLFSTCWTMSMYKEWSAKTDGVRYFPDSHYMFGYNAGMEWVNAYPFTDASSTASWNNLKMWGMFAFGLNAACSFFSDYSYCNDVTTLAYTKDNLKRMRERNKKAKMANL